MDATDVPLMLYKVTRVCFSQYQPHWLYVCWGDQEMEMAISCKKKKQISQGGGLIDMVSGTVPCVKLHTDVINTIDKSKCLPLQRWRGTCRHSWAVSQRAVGSPPLLRPSSTHPRGAPSGEAAPFEVPPPSELPALSHGGIGFAPGVEREGTIHTIIFLLSLPFPLSSLIRAIGRLLKVGWLRVEACVWVWSGQKKFFRYGGVDRAHSQ